MYSTEILGPYRPWAQSHTGPGPSPTQALGRVPYRPWAQAQQKGPVVLRPSWSFLKVRTSVEYRIPRGDRSNVPGQIYELFPGNVIFTGN